ncbi:hypothetical protein QO004_004229 [Rhizobium mesoamericanum]|nr:hypothetical protein [Rhizobium mesoamericanum]MDQ0562424.1 hypothetical protein [Rhizobium mesoamericanum]
MFDADDLLMTDVEVVVQNIPAGRIETETLRSRSAAAAAPIAEAG